MLFLSRLRRKQGCPILISVIAEVLAITLRQEKEIKVIHFGKKEIKLSLFTDNMICLWENTEESIKTNKQKTNQQQNQL